MFVQVAYFFLPQPPLFLISDQHSAPPVSGVRSEGSGNGTVPRSAVLAGAQWTPDWSTLVFLLKIKSEGMKKLFCLKSLS